MPGATEVAPTAVTNGQDAGSWPTKLPTGLPAWSVPLASRHSCDCEYATPPSPEDATKVIPVKLSCVSGEVSAAREGMSGYTTDLAHLGALSLDDGRDRGVDDVRVEVVRDGDDVRAGFVAAVGDAYGGRTTREQFIVLVSVYRGIYLGC